MALEELSFQAWHNLGKPFGYLRFPSEKQAEACPKEAVDDEHAQCPGARVDGKNQSDAHSYYAGQNNFGSIAHRSSKLLSATNISNSETRVNKIKSPDSRE